MPGGDSTALPAQAGPAAGAPAGGIDLGHGIRLRHAAVTDHAALTEICLRTGDAGGDAGGTDDDPTLLGAVFAVPYQILAPDHAFVIEDRAGVCGYVLGTPDTRAFAAACRRDWFPGLAARTRDPGPDPAQWRGFDWVRAMIHRPEPGLPPALSPWPAHAHIDLLPRAQGKGLGRAALGHLMAGLQAAGAPGLHLGVHPENRPAQAFYARLGFAPLRHRDLPAGTVFMVRALAPGPAG